jgi:hypothetical protein
MRSWQVRKCGRHRQLLPATLRRGGRSALGRGGLQVRTKWSNCCEIGRKGNIRWCTGARGVSGDQNEAAISPEAVEMMPAWPQQWRTQACNFASLAAQSGEKIEGKWRGEGGLLIGVTGASFDDRNRRELTPGGIHCAEEMGAIDARWKMTLTDGSHLSAGKQNRKIK